jgi:hypothetical protein
MWSYFAMLKQCPGYGKNTRRRTVPNTLELPNALLGKQEAPQELHEC